MFDVFSDIWNSIRDLPYLVADFLVMIVNGLVVAIGTMAAAIYAVLPGFPEYPGAPEGGILGLLNWIAPLGPMISSFGLLIVTWTAFLGFKAGLKWVKAL